MNLADSYKLAIDDLTEDRPGGPDLATCLASGRRHRRERRSLVGGAAATALVAATLSAAWPQRPHQEVAIDGFGDQPSYQDFVPGTDIDETMQATIAQHVPVLLGADKIYPSDWNRNTALPDAEAQNATDWEAHFSLGTHESATVSMFKKIPGEAAPHQCRPDMNVPGLPCQEVDRTDGSVVLHYAMDLGTLYRIATIDTAADGSLVQAFDDVKADSMASALQQASLPQDQLQALVSDAAMTFPDPVVTPAPPTS